LAVYLNATLFLAGRVWVFHPALALFFYLVAVAICVGVLMAVASARGRSGLWSLFGVWLIPGLLIGLLVLIALPSNARPPATPSGGAPA